MKNIICSVLLFALSACSQTTTTHGQVLLPSRLAQVQPGVSTKGDVARLLGSPSTTGTLADSRWVYVSSVMRDKPLNPDILEKRTVVVVDFDPSGTVVAVTDKSEADSKEVVPDATQTQTHGQSMGIIDGLMNNMGGLTK
ncbi:MAG: outer membrane protein assembly factor BamE [Alphaproteobacteria bacterium]